MMLISGSKVTRVVESKGRSSLEVSGEWCVVKVSVEDEETKTGRRRDILMQDVISVLRFVTSST